MNLYYIIKKYGVDKIYLYDNNDEDGEKFEDVISSEIKKGFVEIINWRGKTSPLLDIMNDCYKNNIANYGWLLFYDIDEYIHLHNYNIKSFLNQEKFEGCQLIYLNMICHTDNNKLTVSKKISRKSLKNKIFRKEFRN